MAPQQQLEPSQSSVIREEVERVLQSPPFRTSKRCQQFLTYVAEARLAGRESRLKERVIGTEVFDRRADYDPGEDATVRVTANEVRKRLAQYYSAQPATPHRVRIDLPPGSYVPEFRFVQDAAPPTLAPPVAAVEPKPRRWWTWAIAAGLLLGGMFVGRNWLMPQAPFDEFWTPIRNSGRPVLICMTHPVVYLLREEFAAEYARGQRIDQFAGPWMVDPSKAHITSHDVVPVPDGFVGAADAAATGKFLQTLSRMNHEAELRIGNDISFADLRNSPAIAIGAYSNRWTMQANAEYRFAFEHLKVIDRKNPGREWKLPSITPDYRSTEDYAIISRVVNSHTGQFFLAAAGITQSGTQAAAEFLTEPKYLNDAMSKAPKDWMNRNLQILLHTRVTGRTPGPPRVIELHVW